MVSKGLSQAASLLALAMGTAAFVPSNIAGVRNINTNTVVEQKIESCDAMLARNPGKVCCKVCAYDVCTRCAQNC